LETATFEDLPVELQPRAGESREQTKARWAWLEEHGLSVFDYITWKRAQNPATARRPPARRKLMTADALAELDERLAREGIRPPTTKTPKEVKR
jgi:hypothetical protein